MKGQWRQHLAFWLALWIIYSTVEIILAGGSSFASMSTAERVAKGLTTEAIIMQVRMALAYWLMFAVLPRFWAGRRTQAVLWGIGGWLLAIVLHRLMIFYVIYPYVYKIDYGATPGLLIWWTRHLWAGIDLLSVATIALAVWLVRLRIDSLKREAELLRERHVAELRFLRAQLNPHFLFNTLNNVYALARRQDERTAPVVMRLSQLLRFMLYEGVRETIPLAEEIQFLRDYAALEQLRYGRRLTFSLRESIDDWQHPIPPLLLLPPVENAFKHGAGERRFQCRIDVDVRLQAGRLSLVVENDYDAEEHTGETTGIGLQNLRRQLDLLYPDRHELTAGGDGGVFRLALTINFPDHAPTHLSDRRGRTAGGGNPRRLYPADAPADAGEQLP